MGAGLKRAATAAKATRKKPVGKIVNVRVWLPPGLEASIHQVTAIDHNKTMHVLQVISANEEPT